MPILTVAGLIAKDCKNALKLTGVSAKGNWQGLPECRIWQTFPALSSPIQSHFYRYRTELGWWTILVLAMGVPCPRKPLSSWQTGLVFHSNEDPVNGGLPKIRGSFQQKQTCRPVVLTNTRFLSSKHRINSFQGHALWPTPSLCECMYVHKQKGYT